jgi:hypothetical protein
MRQFQSSVKLAMLGVIVLFILTACGGGGGGGGVIGAGSSTATLQSITVTAANQIIASGATQQFTALGTYSDSTTKNITSTVSWASSNTEIATINNAGLATAITVGATTVTATSGSVTGNTKLTISNVAAVSLKSGQFGAIMVSKSGEEMLLPMVDRNATGSAIKITGAMYVNNVTGANAVVYADDNGKPTKAIIGDFILLFSNWSTDSTRVDIAKIYTPTNYIEVYRGVNVAAKISNSKVSAAAMQKTLQLTCFPRCDSDTKNLAELLKLSGVLLSYGTCTMATAGTMFIPCAGFVIGAASFVAGDEAWLGIQTLDNGFLLYDSYKCFKSYALDVGSCTSAYLNMSGKIMDVCSNELNDYKASTTFANSFLVDNNQPSGIVQQGGGLPTVPSGKYECTPGGSMHYLPCFPDGVRECQSNYTWGTCSSSTMCTSFIYSGWSACQSNNVQTRTIITRNPYGCTGGTPETLTRSCTYIPPTCTYSYSDWSACQSNTQTRTVISKSPDGCSGTPELTKSCTDVPLPNGFPTNVPNGNYSLICNGSSQVIQNNNINKFSQDLVSILNSATSQAVSTTCNGSGCTCDYNIAYTPWTGTYFTMTDTINVTCCSGGSCSSSSVPIMCNISAIP